MGKCLRCGSADQRIADCPVRLREGKGIQQPTKTNPGLSKEEGTEPKVPTRVYSLDQCQVPDSSENVEDTILVFCPLPQSLIDSSGKKNFENEISLRGRECEDP